jgi:DNA polymerase III epsilon subunit-like protein
MRSRVKAQLDRLYESNAVIVDLETTGLTRHDEAIEIGAISLEGDVLFHEYLQPRFARRNRAATANRLRSFPEVSDGLAEILSHKTAIAYNADFDVRLLGQTAAVWGVPFPKIRSVCAMKMRMEFYGDRKWKKLGGPHDAIGDCRKLLELLERMRGKTVSTTVSEETLQKLGMGDFATAARSLQEQLGKLKLPPPPVRAKAE